MDKAGMIKRNQEHDLVSSLQSWSRTRSESSVNVENWGWRDERTSKFGIQTQKKKDKGSPKQDERQNVTKAFEPFSSKETDRNTVTDVIDSWDKDVVAAAAAVLLTADLPVWIWMSSWPCWWVGSEGLSGCPASPVCSAAALRRALVRPPVLQQPWVSSNHLL